MRRRRSSDSSKQHIQKKRVILSVSEFWTATTVCFLSHWISKSTFPQLGILWNVYRFFCRFEVLMPFNKEDSTGALQEIRVCMFLQCLLGFSTGTLASSHRSKECKSKCKFDRRCGCECVWLFDLSSLYPASHLMTARTESCLPVTLSIVMWEMENELIDFN